jgi:excisionase family DNA binding protein
MNPLLSTKDSCRVLGGISLRTLFRLIEANQLRPIRVGRRIFFSEDELKRFISENGASS